MLEEWWDLDSFTFLNHIVILRVGFFNSMPYPFQEEQICCSFPSLPKMNEAIGRKKSDHQSSKILKTHGSLFFLFCYKVTTANINAPVVF